MFDQNLIIGLVVLAILGAVFYAVAPQIFRGILPGYRLKSGGMEMFADKKKETFTNPGLLPQNPGVGVPGAMPPNGSGMAETNRNVNAIGGDDNLGPVPMAQDGKVAGCYPREQLNPAELLPNDPNSQWAQVNPQGAGDIQGKNFLSAGALVGVNTVGQSLRNANYQLRSEPPNPQVQVGPWQASTIEPDLQRRPLE